MNCIICADITSCQLLEEFVRKSTSLNLIGTYSDSASVRQQLSKGKDIDLFFVDIEIPDLDFFNYIKNLDYQPKIVIISDNVQNALRAFDFNAVDYLLKPVNYSRFFKAIDKAMKFHSQKESKTVVENEIFIKKGSSLVKLRLADLVYIEALENYITLHTKDEKFTIHFTMKAFEDQLLAGIFIRVHRSFIVNKSMIQAIREDSLDLMFGDKLKNIPIGNSFREALMNSLNMMVR
jgi:DNA-binding LytR/AlgR family response regulator